jgi:hypothetical protein
MPANHDVLTSSQPEIGPFSRIARRLQHDADTSARAGRAQQASASWEVDLLLKRNTTLGHLL